MIPKFIITGLELNDDNKIRISNRLSIEYHKRNKIKN